MKGFVISWCILLLWPLYLYSMLTVQAAIKHFNSSLFQEAQRHIAAGGKVSDLPPPPPMDTSDYVQCPHCSRYGKFYKVTLSISIYIRAVSVGWLVAMFRSYSEMSVCPYVPRNVRTVRCPYVPMSPGMFVQWDVRMSLCPQDCYC